MSTDVSARSPLSRADFIEWLRSEGKARYHDAHPFHILMHDGKLTKPQLQAWVCNRYYYQTRIPIKDALIVAKSEDPRFRRLWLHRVVDHDGARDGEGGLALWLKLAEGTGLDPARVASLTDVLPGVRFACDAYVQLVRERTLVEAVASSLTEFFAPDLMTRRIASWEEHYPFVDRGTLDYFRTRVARARTDSEEALEYVVANARTYAVQERCVSALVDKTRILWHLLDCVHAQHVLAGPERRDDR